MHIQREDLSFLYTTTMDWANYIEDWKPQIESERFESLLGDDIAEDFDTAYWLPDYVAAMVFRDFLTRAQIPFQILLDNAEGLDPYVVLVSEEF
jgi:hypothetical protein